MLDRISTRLRLFAAGLAAVTAVLTLPAGPAAAAQHVGGSSYVNWTATGSNYWNVDQYMMIERKGASTFWALQWFWSGGVPDGGYVGLQTGGTLGETGIFSIWNATAASGPNCATFGGEGVGYSCKVAYPINVNRWYRYRVWRLNADTLGQWWGAWITDTSTGVETWIGSIRAPSGAVGTATPSNFEEYFGTAVACNAVPRSIVNWTQPAFNSLGGGVYQYGSSYAGSSNNTCVTATATAKSYPTIRTRGVRVVFGSV